MTEDEVDFFVPGIPAPKGSTKSFMPKGAKFPVTTTDCKRTKPWQAIVAYAASQHMLPGMPWDCAVSLDLNFYLPRPPSISVKKRPYPTVKPDLDKLVRCIGDALKGVFYTDDARVVSGVVSKWYANPEVGEVPGVRIVTRTMDPAEVEGAE